MNVVKEAYERQAERRKSMIFWIVCLLCVVPPLIVELGFKIPMTIRFYGGYMGTISLLLLPFVVTHFRKANVLAYLTFLILVHVIWLTPWTLRKQFYNDYRSLKKGMTLAQVEDRMKPYVIERYVEDGHSAFPGQMPDYLIVHPAASGEFKKDRIRIVILNGKASVIYYSR